MSGESGIRRAIGGVVYGNRFTTAIRLFLGGVMLFSGIVKLMDPALFGEAVARYELLPALLVPYAATIIPALELLVGLSLIIGFRVRASAALSVLLMALFIAAVSINLALGRRFDCGCYQPAITGLFFVDIIGPWTLIRNMLFLAGFALLFSADRHLMSIEHSIERTRLKNLEKAKYE